MKNEEEEEDIKDVYQSSYERILLWIALKEFIIDRHIMQDKISCQLLITPLAARQIGFIFCLHNWFIELEHFSLIINKKHYLVKSRPNISDVLKILTDNRSSKKQKHF